MQFKHPELLWALFLLLIPLFIHLFQLRRFKKTPFTNVKLLQRVVVESRKSNTLKKWLLLFTRLLLLASLILAFAQPFFAKETALVKKEVVIYLDNSYSMQGKNNNVSLLENGIQELIKAIPQESTFSLFTNNITYREVELMDVQNDLLSINHSQKQLKLNEIQLKASTLFSNSVESIKNLIIISDFQQRMLSNNIDSSQTYIQKHLVQLLPEKQENIVIDTAYVSDVLSNTLELTTELSSLTSSDNIAVSLFNDESLIAKTSADFDSNRRASLVFTLPKNEIINGKIEVLDAGLSYDNALYFNINEKEKIEVLAISEVDSGFLSRIFTDDEFQYKSYSLQNLNYSVLESQNLIILNELSTVPNSLQNALISFKRNGGSLVIIPSNNIGTQSYNELLSNINSSTFSKQIMGGIDITQINFSHPLFTNVFEKKVTNFQYPTVSQYYEIQSTMPPVLSFENGNPFLIGENGLYIFTSPLSKESSNFIASPIIVPTLYNMGARSLKLPKLYNLMGEVSGIDISTNLGKDNILKLVQGDYEFIPQQQSFPNKVTLTFDDNLERNGIYTVQNGNEALKNISFNNPRKESELAYLDLNILDATTKQSTISTLFEELENDNRVTDLWKWFVILALLFILIEILIQKVFK